MVATIFDMRWKVLRSSEIFKAGFFRLRVDECELPDGRVQPRYYVMEFVDWVNVVPVTDEGQVVMVEQYRHGADQSFLEIPGGSANDIHEDPRIAGERELREETGYEAREWIYCGFHYPNPALQNNKMHTYLALGCRLTAMPQLDPFEDLSVRTLPLQEMVEKWSRGELKHSLIAASIGLSLQPLRERGLIRGPSAIGSRG